MTTKEIVRLSKTILVTAVGVYFFLVFLDNLLDYQSNFSLVEHVMSMDSISPRSASRWRSIHYPFIYHVGFLAIIMTEGLVSYLCLTGGYHLYKARTTAHSTFQAAKRNSILGLTLCFVLMVTGFLTLGGEWFLMWQSNNTAGTLNAASRLFTLCGIVLIYLNLPETE